MNDKDPNLYYYYLFSRKICVYIIDKENGNHKKYFSEFFKNLHTIPFDEALKIFKNQYLSEFYHCNDYILYSDKKSNINLPQYEETFKDIKRIYIALSRENNIDDILE